MLILYIFGYNIFLAKYVFYLSIYLVVVFAGLRIQSKYHSNLRLEYNFREFTPLAHHTGAAVPCPCFDVLQVFALVFDTGIDLQAT